MSGKVAAQAGAGGAWPGEQVGPSSRRSLSKVAPGQLGWAGVTGHHGRLVGGLLWALWVGDGAPGRGRQDFTGLCPQPVPAQTSRGVPQPWAGTGLISSGEGGQEAGVPLCCLLLEAGRVLGPSPQAGPTPDECAETLLLRHPKRLRETSGRSQDSGSQPVSHGDGEGISDRTRSPGSEHHLAPAPGDSEMTFPIQSTGPAGPPPAPARTGPQPSAIFALSPDAPAVPGALSLPAPELHQLRPGEGNTLLYLPLPWGQEAGRSSLAGGLF